MPANKNALIRYQVLDSCLRNRARKWTWKNLLEEVNKKLHNEGIEQVGKTTLFEDLKDIEYRIFKSEIEKTYGENKKIVYYQYADPEYSINKQPLTEEEASQIRSAINIIARFTGLPQFDWVNEIIPALETKFNLKPDRSNIISFEYNEFLRGKEFISLLFNAIYYERVLKISYQDFKSDFPYEIIFHPYHLKQYNSRWFVFGHNPDASYPIQNLALDRIHRIIETELKYRINKIDWNEYFGDIIGVTISEDEIVQILIRINNEEQASYIKTKPLHQSQRPIKKVGEYFETIIKVKPNTELYKSLLAYGPSITVLSPRSVVEKMKHFASVMNSLY
jgi:predicted DNA-binding transcriptional regulator YafY